MENYKEFILSAVGKQGQTLQFVPFKFRDDKDVVLAAVQQNGMALKYASAALQDDKGVILSAVKQDGMALQYTSDRLKNDTEIILTALQNNPMSLEFVNNNIIDDNKELFLLVLKMGKRQLKDANAEFCNDKNIVLAAIARDILAVEFIGEALRNNSDILALIQQKSSALINNLEIIIENNYNVTLAYLFDLHIDFNKLFVNDVPFLIVLIKSRSQFIESLICKINSATINLSDMSNKTALYYALETAQNELIKQLITSGATIKNIPNKYLDYDFIKFALENNGDNYQYITETQYLDNIELARLARKTAKAPAVITILNYKIKLYDAREQLEQECVSDYLNVVNLYQSENYSEFITSDEFDALKVKFIQKWYQENIPAKIPNNKEYRYVQIDDEQALAIATVNCNVKVTARAGSGKTATLVNRALFLHKHCKIQWNEMLIMAFNKKAAAEVNRRIEYITKFWDADSPKITVAKTFHSFAYSIVKNSGNHQTLIMDNDDESQIEREIAITPKKIIGTIHKQLLRDDPVVKLNELLLSMRKYLSADEDNKIYSSAKLYQNKQPQKLAISNIECDNENEQLLAMLLSCCGITFNYKNSARIKNIGAIPLLFQFETYNKKYAIVTKDLLRIRDNFPKMVVIDFNSLKFDLIEQFLENLITSIKVNQYQQSFAFNLVDNLQLSSMSLAKLYDAFEFDVAGYIGFIDYARQKQISPDEIEYKNKSFNYRELFFKDFVEIAIKLYSGYLAKLKQNDKIDFIKILELAHLLINCGSHKFGEKIGEVTITRDVKKLRYLFIDEYQDFSKLFNQLVQAVRNSNHHVLSFCVGDDWQAINGYAGSELEYFDNFSKYFGDISRNLAISTNYRSDKKIVELGNFIMQGNGILCKPSADKPEGNIYIINESTFSLTHYEQLYLTKYDRQPDVFLASLLRVIQKNLTSGNDIILLSRANTAKIPTSKSKLEELKLEISKYFPSSYRYIEIENPHAEKNNTQQMLSISTAHSFKGGQKTAVILLDPYRFPLVHPDWEYQAILDQTEQQIKDEEERLLYVAATRAQSTFYIFDFVNSVELSKKRAQEHNQRMKSWMDNLSFNDIILSEYPPVEFPEDKILFKIIATGSFAKQLFDPVREMLKNKEKTGLRFSFQDDLEIWHKIYNLADFKKLNTEFSTISNLVHEALNQHQPNDLIRIQQKTKVTLIVEIDGRIIRYAKLEHRYQNYAYMQFEAHLHKIASKSCSEFMAQIEYELETKPNSFPQVLTLTNSYGANLLFYILCYPEAVDKLNQLEEIFDKYNLVAEYNYLLKSVDKAGKNLIDKSIDVNDKIVYDFLLKGNKENTNIIFGDELLKRQAKLLNHFANLVNIQKKYELIERFVNLKLDFNLLLNFLITDDTADYTTRVLYLRNILYVYQSQLRTIVKSKKFKELAANHPHHDFISLVESFVLTDEYEEIRDTVSARGIRQLVHFTNVNNLTSIFDNKQLLSLQKLQKSGVKFNNNDDKRLERFHNCLCCSLTSININLLIEYLRRSGYKSFCILKLNPRYIYKQGTYFSMSNAAREAKNEILQFTFDGLHGFNHLFDNQINNIQRDINCPDNQPTDLQAEVLIEDSIHVSDIFEVIFNIAPERLLLDRIRQNFPWITISINPKMFEMSDNKNRQELNSEMSEDIPF